MIIRLLYIFFEPTPFPDLSGLGPGRKGHYVKPNPPKSPDSPLAPVPPLPLGWARIDPDYIAFRALVRQAERDPELAAELTRAMAEGWPLSRVLSLASSAGEAATTPPTRTPGIEAVLKL